tara:strand:- start:130 stop:510 length:381 start_codon:yes stop_codon:yes gene_type:complete
MEPKKNLRLIDVCEHNGPLVEKDLSVRPLGRPRIFTVTDQITNNDLDRLIDSSAPENANAYSCQPFGPNDRDKSEALEYLNRYLNSLVSEGIINSQPGVREELLEVNKFVSVQYYKLSVDISKITS